MSTKTVITYFDPMRRTSKTVEFDEEWRAKSFVMKMRKSGYRILDVKVTSKEAESKESERLRGRTPEIVWIDEAPNVMTFGNVISSVADACSDIASSITDTFSGDGGSFSGGGSSDEF